MASKRASFRTLLQQPRPLVSPMAHDALSARLIERAGFEATGLSGSATLAAHHALPDIGLAGLGEMLEGARVVLRGMSIPWGADADDGFGDVKNVVHTVRSFEALGCGQLVLEDQQRANKRPGDGGAQTLVTAAEMAGKLQAALRTRDDPDLMIIARTDAALNEGLDGALRRAERYLEAGADGVFVAGLQTPEQLRRVGETLRGAMLMAVVGERRIRIWPGPSELYAMGFQQISYPGLLINRVFSTMQEGLAALNDLIGGEMQPDAFPDRAPAVDGLAQALDMLAWEATARFAEVN